MIYAIEAVGSGFIKFGKSKSVGKRLRELECACPHDLHILAVADWPDGAETAIHSYLEPVAQRGEWFRDGELARQVIGWMTSGAQGLESLREERRINIKRTAIPVEPGPIERRRAQREAWWKQNENSL